jgi:enoyl-CoA hydratase/carnithine racemase
VVAEGGVITVTIDRESKRNAISPQVTQALWDAVRALATQDDLRCLVITAVGTYFTAGLDLAAASQAREAAANTPPRQQPGWAYRRDYRQHHQLYDEIEAIEKPVVLAAQGTCLGAGVEMALSCDFRLCTPIAEWGLPEVSLGVIPGSGGASRLARVVGPAWAKYLTMTGKRIGAELAERIGLVHQVFPVATFEAEVMAFARRFVELPAEAVGMAKLAVDLATDVTDRAAQRQVDRLINTNLTSAPGYRERLKAFAKGRADRVGTGGSEQPE